MQAQHWEAAAPTDPWILEEQACNINLLGLRWIWLKSLRDVLACFMYAGLCRLF